MLEQLFNSKIRVKILNLLFQNEGKRFYVQEIIKLIKTDSANTHRELIKLKKLSILESEKVGNQKYYFLNQGIKYYKGLNELFKSHGASENKEEWFHFEEIPPRVNPNSLIFYMHIPYVNAYLKSQGFKERIEGSLMEFSKQTVNLYFLTENFKKVEEEILEKLINDPKWGLEYIKSTISFVDNYFLTSKKVYNTNLKDLTNKELYDLHVKHSQKELKMRYPGWIQNTVEMNRQLFSKYLLEYLKKRKKDKNSKKSAGDAFSLLSTPLMESYAQKEYKNLLKICLEIKKNKEAHDFLVKNELHIIEEEIEKYKKLNNLLNNHVLKYGWLSYQYVGPGWKKDYFIDIISSILRQKTDIEKTLREEEGKINELKKEQTGLISELGIDSDHQNLFAVARGMVFTKNLRKDSLFYGYYCQDFINKEIARRKFLSVAQVRNIYFWEFEDILLKNKNISEELNKRLDYHICLSRKDKSRIYSGEKAHKFMESIKLKERSIDENTKEILGECAAPGKIRGVTHIVNTPEDMKSFKNHDVLVSISTSPDLMPAIKKSNAIITDIGGMTCHAAIVSRELGKPCVVGTKISTKILKNGDIVDVDATHGKITIIKKAK